MSYGSLKSPTSTGTRAELWRGVQVQHPMVLGRDEEAPRLQPGSAAP